MVSNIPNSALPPNPAPDWSALCGRRATVRTIPEVSLLTAQFAAELAADGFSDREIFGLRMAVEEAVVNGIKHGNGGDPSKLVRVRYSVTPQQVLLLIEDEGPGFKPGDVPDPLAEENLDRPSGRGVFLMRFYMTWVEFNERGNCVTMCKKRA